LHRLHSTPKPAASQTSPESSEPPGARVLLDPLNGVLAQLSPDSRQQGKGLPGHPRTGRSLVMVEKFGYSADTGAAGGTGSGGPIGLTAATKRTQGYYAADQTNPTLRPNEPRRCDRANPDVATERTRRCVQTNPTLRPNEPDAVTQRTWRCDPTNLTLRPNETRGGDQTNPRNLLFSIG
jgi:hypothetical protein